MACAGVEIGGGRKRGRVRVVVKGNPLCRRVSSRVVRGWASELREGCIRRMFSGASRPAGLVWSVPWTGAAARARAHERWSLPLRAHRHRKVGIRLAHLRLRRSISRVKLDGQSNACETVSGRMEKGAKFHEGCFGINNGRRVCTR